MNALLADVDQTTEINWDNTIRYHAEGNQRAFIVSLKPMAKEIARTAAYKYTGTSLAHKLDEAELYSLAMLAISHVAHKPKNTRLLIKVGLKEYCLMNIKRLIRDAECKAIQEQRTINRIIYEKKLAQRLMAV